MLDQLDDQEQIERKQKWEHTATICSLLAEINRDPTKKKDPFTIADFMPKFMDGNQPPPKKVQTWQEQKTIIEILNAAFGGEDTRG